MQRRCRMTLLSLRSGVLVWCWSCVITPIKRCGFSGWRRGKTRKLSYAFFVIYLIHLFGSMWLNSQGHQWIIPVSAVSIFVIAQIYGRVWMSTWRKEMEAEDVG